MSGPEPNPFAVSEQLAPETHKSSSRFGCLMTILGAISGLGIGAWWESKVFAQMREEDPNAVIDFLPIMPFWGFVLGAVIGQISGSLLSSFLFVETPKPGTLHSDATEPQN